MINHEGGNYKCDYCGDENGEFLTATGNHATCQRVAELEATLPYLQACAAEWDFFATLEGTDASKVRFMEQTVKKLAKMRKAAK